MRFCAVYDFLPSLSTLSDMVPMVALCNLGRMPARSDSTPELVTTIEHGLR